MWPRILRWLHHDRLAVRVASALVIGHLLIFAGWIAGYYLLPERALHGWLSSGAPIEPTSLVPLAAQLFAYNVCLPGLATVWLSRVQAGGYSLGYNVPFLNSVLYGLWLGTNSFAVPLPQRLAPTLAVYYTRSGPYEMTALLLVAAALARTASIVQETFWGGRTVYIPAAERRLHLREYLVIAFAVLLLAVANTVEAWMWLEAIRT